MWSSSSRRKCCVSVSLIQLLYRCRRENSKHWGWYLQDSFTNRNIWLHVALFPDIWIRTVRYDNIYCVTIENCLSFHIMLYFLFVCCVANHTLYGNIFVIWKTLCSLWHGTDAGGKFVWRQHKQTWRRVNVMQNGVNPRWNKELVPKRGSPSVAGT